MNDKVSPEEFIQAKIASLAKRITKIYEGEIVSLRQAKADLEIENKILNARINALNLIISTSTTPSTAAVPTKIRKKTHVEVGFVPGSLSFTDFKARVLQKHAFERNKEQGWQQLFVDCNNKGYTQAHLNRWKKTDIVPPEAVAEIDNLDLSKRVVHHHWTAGKTSFSMVMLSKPTDSLS